MKNEEGFFAFIRELWDLGGTVLPPTWQCSATAVTEFSHCNGRTVRRQWENCATEAGELCCFYSPSFLAIFLGIAFLWIRMFMVL